MPNPDVPSVEAVFVAYGEELRRRARRILGSEADADDAVQEVMLTILEAPGILGGVDRIAGWLLTVVHRKCTDIIRSDARRRTRESSGWSDELFSPGDDPCEIVENEENAKAVAEAIKGLPAPLGDVFRANALDDLTFREISDATGVPMGTLMARKMKAVELIRQELARRGIIPPREDEGMEDSK